MVANNEDVADFSNFKSTAFIQKMPTKNRGKTWELKAGCMLHVMLNAWILFNFTFWILDQIPTIFPFLGFKHVKRHPQHTSSPIPKFSHKIVVKPVETPSPLPLATALQPVTSSLGY